jgi:hypothetical protein
MHSNHSKNEMIINSFTKNFTAFSEAMRILEKATPAPSLKKVAKKMMKAASQPSAAIISVVGSKGCENVVRMSDEILKALDGRTYRLYKSVDNKRVFTIYSDGEMTEKHPTFGMLPPMPATSKRPRKKTYKNMPLEARENIQWRDRVLYEYAPGDVREIEVTLDMLEKHRKNIHALPFRKS